MPNGNNHPLSTLPVSLSPSLLSPRHHSDPSHFVTIFLHSFFSILTPYPTRVGGSTEFSQLFGIECTPNKRVEPLCSSVNTNCTGQTDRQTESHTFPSVSLFLKGLPPKQPEGFGCFVYPNSHKRGGPKFPCCLCQTEPNFCTNAIPLFTFWSCSHQHNRPRVPK